METNLKRAFGAALALALAPLAAPGDAAAQQSRQYPAIATGLAIPVGQPALRKAPIVSRREVLVDAASATLFMLEDGRVVDSMKVIVGKPDAATPELKTMLTYTTVNPYWHVPTDIARTLTAPNVLKHGRTYLDERGYEVVSSFGSDARVIDPESVDWQAVAEGRAKVFVRQRPGPANSMGRMKFSLLNAGGIFLHDTPKKELFDQDNRSLSAGCIRLEDAERFARWLLGDEVTLASAAAEQQIPLRSMIPITITYLDPQSGMQLAALR